MKKSLFLLCSILYTLASYAQKDAFITFSSKAKLFPVEIYKNIDGAYQTLIECDDQVESISVVKDQDRGPISSQSYKIKVDDFATVFIKIPKKRLALFLFPGDRLTINIADENRVEIMGSNAAAHRYYNENFLSNGNLKFVSAIRTVALQSESLGKIAEYMEQTMFKGIQDSLEVLRKNEAVSPRLLSLLWDDVSLNLYQEVYSILRDLPLNKSLSEDQKSAALVEMDKMLTKMPSPQSHFIKYPLCKSYLMNYYEILFGRMNDQEKQQLLQGYSKDTFGPYASYLLAPDAIRLPLLGSAIVTEQKFGMPGEFEPIVLEKTFEYLKKLYPQSEYVALLKKDIK